MADIARRTLLIWLAGITGGAIAGKATAKPVRLSPKTGTYSDTYSNTY